ncbi:MAG: Bax inhibitor-1 family protein [Zoogloeaceae bacterium]|jgi:FtsH-binding integral membrane protein|nr:Bax inhibitor-1 family protein [Zoogloeaceae bacterium]
MSEFLTSVTTQEEKGAVSRAQFVVSAYLYLGGAILAFVLLSFALYYSGFGNAVVTTLGASQYAWLGILGAFMVVGWLASSIADKAESNTTQIMGLGIYVIAEACIFSPMFAIAAAIMPGAIPVAVVATLLLTAGLTWTAISSKKDFSFMGGMLRVGGMVALGVIVVGVFFGFSLGVWFSAAMILLAGGCILYDTSNILRHYPTDRPAGAALHLFASIALLLWYVLRFVMQFAGDD